MKDGIDPWDLLHEKQIREALEAHEAHPEYAAIVKRAKAKGFRPATLHEIVDDTAGLLFQRPGCGIVWAKGDE
jgi:hypothetical protein